VVLVEGTTTGTISGEDGGFSFSVPAGDIVLDVSNLGYIPQKVTVPAATGNVTVYLQENAIQLDAAVVVGYGTQKRVNLTGAVAVVDSKQLADRAAHSVTNMLQGAVPGLNITTSNGKPGSTPAINIRGFTSISNPNAAPLIMIDGAVGDLNNLNSNDVESVSVIKDASAAAVFGGRATYGVILVTTKSGKATDGKATVRYSGRFGWEEATTSTDYENRGYWSVYTINKFWQADSGKNYVDYTDYDMQQLLARVNDKTEHPDRPWTVEDTRNGRKQWVYYGNYDWWDMNFRQKRPSQQHSISLSGGNKDVKYMVSGAYDQQKGIQRAIPDVLDKYNLRSKIDFKVNKWIDFSNNTSFFASQYTSLGDGSVDNTIGYLARHALANFPMQNPDGSWLYSTPYLSYKVANGRHILLNEGTHRNVDRYSDFANTSRLVLKPLKTLSITGDYTYRLYQSRNTSRSSPMWYREYPDADLASYSTGAGQNQLDENINTYNHNTVNAFISYDETFNDAHHLSATGGVNYETYHRKYVGAWGQDLSSITMDDLKLVGQNDLGETITGVSGGQGEWVLFGTFARVNYDYKGRYLVEVSGRYDGSSRFLKGHHYGLFPSGSIGWRISEEPFFKPAQKYVDNLKLRASLGTLGNQNISDFYPALRSISISNFAGYSFNEGGSMAKYSSLSGPTASDMTWEMVEHWNLGLDLTMFQGRFNLTADTYIRDTNGMLTESAALPAVYGASPPRNNAADLRTKGYEISASWRDQFILAGKPFEYSFGFNVSDSKTVITKYDNPEKSFAKAYYEGMEVGEIWGFVTDGYFATDEEARAYAQEVDLSYQTSRLTGGWLAGDLKFLDIDGDGKWGIGANTVDKPGDRKKLGNSRPDFSYGINASIKWMGFDASVFFQGTGNHYWYPNAQMMPFWGPYSYSYVTFLEPNFLDKVWAEDNTDSYFPRARAYSSSGGYLSKINDRYLQNIRYLRLKNLTVGYTIPMNATKKIGVEQVRVYFSGENLAYWSPIKKNSAYVDPEAAISRSNEVYDNAYYPWSKTIMFGVDITF
jgi:TonB-linked SusC/RagA family outer membrane protein